MTNQTKNCIICGEKAIMHTGHVLTKKHKSVIAGFCAEHKNTECKQFGGIPGCFGFYQKFMGKIKW